MLSLLLGGRDKDWNNFGATANNCKTIINISFGSSLCCLFWKTEMIDLNKVNIGISLHWVGDLILFRVEFFQMGPNFNGTRREKSGERSLYLG